MKKGNIEDTLASQNEQKKEETGTHLPVSKELEEAIESLIIQLREIGPLNKTPA